MLMESYKQKHRYYSVASGVIAVSVFLVSSLVYFFAARLLLSQGMRLHVPASIISIAIVCACVLIVGDGIDSIGFSLRGLWQSTLLGLITGAGFFFGIRSVLSASIFERAYGGVEVQRFLEPDRFVNVPETPLLEWLPLILLFVVISVLQQEVLLRGYVQTRLTGLIKSEFAVIIITGILFVVFNMPMLSVLIGQPLSWVFLRTIPLEFIWMFALHLWLHFLYRTFNNIAAPVIFHVFFSFHSAAMLTYSYFMGF